MPPVISIDLKRISMGGRSSVSQKGHCNGCLLIDLFFACNPGMGKSSF
jgi:hypothetical protein